MNWRDIALAVVGLLLAGTGIILWLRRAPRDPCEIEKRRCAYLNRVGRIIEAQVLEIAESPAPAATRTHRAPPLDPPDGTGAVCKLLYYTYSISGVGYETAQDITGFESRVPLDRIAAGQRASVKYDPANPGNSMLVSDEWSGLH
jgi:hypothetical protein